MDNGPCCCCGPDQNSSAIRCCREDVLLQNTQRTTDNSCRILVFRRFNVVTNDKIGPLGTYFQTTSTLRDISRFDHEAVLLLQRPSCVCSCFSCVDSCPSRRCTQVGKV